MARLLLLIWLAGCAGSSVAPPISSVPANRSQTLPLALAPGVKHVFLSDGALNRVTIFGRHGTARTLSSCSYCEPQLLTTDEGGNLYVAAADDAAVEVFAPPYHDQPTLSIPDPGQAPVDVAVAKDGTIAVINLCRGTGSQCSQPGNVEFFADAQATSPCATVGGGNTISGPIAGAFDSAGTLYVDGINEYTTSRIVAIAGECNAKTLTALKPNVSIHFPAGLQVDPQGHIAVIDSGGFTQGTAIDVFAPPKLGSKKLELVSQNALDDSGVVSSFALTKDGKHLYTAEPHYSLQYAYPQGGYSLAQLSPPPSGGDLIEGVAVTPAEVP